MGSVKTTQIDGSVSVGRDVAVGGSVTLQGGALIKGSVKILGWLEAHNIKLPYKGLFRTKPELDETYPHPHNGWWAIVGDTVPGPIYVAWDGEWKNTGAIGGNIQEIIALDEAKEYADEKAAETLKEARQYTDDRETEIRRDYAEADEDTLREANRHADDGDAEMLATAKGYTDEKTADALGKARDYAEEKAEDAFREAQAYHDGKEQKLRTDMSEADKALRKDMEATDESIRREFTEADAGITEAYQAADQKIVKDYTAADADTLAEAKRYADEKDAEKLQSAKDYANSMDANTLLSAKEYADGKMSEVTEGYKAAVADINEAIETGDATTLQSAKDYADTLTENLVDQATKYTDDAITDVTEAYTAADAVVTEAYKAADKLIDDALKAEITRATKAEQDEETRATGEEAKLQAAIDTEKSRATGEEAAIRKEFQDADGKKVDKSLLGQNNGVAQLDGNGRVPSAQLPSFVDDVLEGTRVSDTVFNKPDGTPYAAEAGKIYIDTTTNKQYRWSGTKYAVISETLALGTTASTAFRGDHGDTAYRHSQLADGTNPHRTTFANIADKPTTLAGYGITDAASTTGMTGALAGKADKSHTHGVADITDKKTLTITLNGAATEGASKVTYDTGTAKTINITPALIGASVSNHTHGDYATKTEITNGTLKAGKAVTADTATTATKLGSATVGGTDTPVYIKEGVPTVVDKVKAAAKADQLDSENIPENADLNSCTTPFRMYRCESNVRAKTLKNCPTDQAFSLFVSNICLDSVIQTMTTYNASDTRKSYQRSYYGYSKVWSEWCRIYTTIDKPTAADVGASASNHTHDSITKSGGGTLKFWTGTQSAYDAITSKDGNTLYVITD